MLTLHKTTSSIQKLAKFIGMGIGLILLIFILYQAGIFVKEFLYPTPPPPPTVSFGKLPSIEFSASLEGTKNSYVLNTITGKLPIFSDRAKVYKVSKSAPNLLAVERAREKVTRIGLSGMGTALSPTVYLWNESAPPYRRLVAEIVNFNFNLTSSYMLDIDVKNANHLPSEDTAVKTAQQFLESLSSFPIDIDTKKTKTVLYRIQGTDLIEATSFSNTQVIRVDFYQKDLDNYPIYYPNPPFSNINLLITGGGIREQVVEAHFFHNEASENSATYPIITAQEAWELLKKGEAHIATQNNPGTISVKDVKLGYYVSNEEQEFVLPIIVFEGDNNFYAYVSAVKKEWFSEEN